MWLASVKRSDWRLLRAAIVGLSLIVLVLAWGMTLKRLESDRALITETARLQQNNLAIIVSENLEQLLDGARTIAIAASEWTNNPPEETVGRLTGMRLANPAFLRLSLYDAQAKRVYSSSAVPDDPHLNAAIQHALEQTTQVDFQGMILPATASAPENA